MSVDRPHTNDKVVDAIVNWKTKHVIKANTREQPQTGIFPYDIGGQTATGDDAIAYMRRLMEYAGLDPDMLPDWQSALKVTKRQVKVFGSHAAHAFIVPQGTLYLMLRADHTGTGAMYPFPDMVPPDDAVMHMRRDTQMQELEGRLSQSCGRKIFRVWLDYRIRWFSRKKPPRYESPMARLHTKAQRVQDMRYHIQLSGIDLIMQ